MPTANPRLVRSIVVALLVLIGVVLVAVEVRGYLRDRHERLGEVTVTSCSFKTFSQHGSVYDCRGSFTGDQSDLAIADVRFEHQGSLAAGERVRATLAGPGDETAHPVSESHWRLAVTSAGALLALGLAVGLWRAPATYRRRPQQPSAGT